MAIQHVHGKNVGHIMLYALSTCPWCKKTKKLLDDLGVEYYYEDVDFLGGDDSYKTYWTKDRRFMRTYSIFNRNITGTLEYCANKLVNSIKSVLQPFHKGGQSS